MNWFILRSFLIWRVGLLLVGVGAFYALPFSWSFPYVERLLIGTKLPEWLWTWGNFDGVHYLSIAHHGYEQFQQAFFPLYPGFMHVVGNLFLWDSRYFLAGFVFSNLSFLASLFVFYRLLLLDFSPEFARKTILLLLVLPYAFFFGALYTEGPFFLFVTASFLLARKGQWWWAGLFGALATATRFVGVFLVPALVVLWWQRQAVLSPPKKFSALFAIALVPLGLFAYMAYLQAVYADPLYFIHAQSFFGANRTGETIILLPQVIWRYGKIFLSVSPHTLTFWNAVIELAVTCATLWLLVKSWRKLPLPYVVFASLAWLTPTLTGSLSSMPRYVLPLFPLWITLVMLVEKNGMLWRVILVVCALLEIVCASLFLRGYFVA